MKNASTAITERRGKHVDHVIKLDVVYLVGSVNYELLTPNKNITKALYAALLVRLSRVLKEKRSTTPDTTKIFFSMIIFVNKLRRLSKPT